jgi:hypothetical protein
MRSTAIFSDKARAKLSRKPEILSARVSCCSWPGRCRRRSGPMSSGDYDTLGIPGHATGDAEHWRFVAACTHAHPLHRQGAAYGKRATCFSTPGESVAYIVNLFGISCLEAKAHRIPHARGSLTSSTRGRTRNRSPAGGLLRPIWAIWPGDAATDHGSGARIP